jgi:hypothetical protein
MWSTWLSLGVAVVEVVFRLVAVLVVCLQVFLVLLLDHLLL